MLCMSAIIMVNKDFQIFVLSELRLLIHEKRRFYCISNELHVSGPKNKIGVFSDYIQNSTIILQPESKFATKKPYLVASSMQMCIVYSSGETKLFGSCCF